MNADTVAILEGNTFVVSDRRGDIEPSPATPHGLFVDDTRFLSRWVLTVDGQRPAILSTDDVEYFEAQFFLAPSSGTVYIDGVLSLMRKRTVARGFIESLVVANHSSTAIDIEIRIRGDADFADLFEVKDARRYFKHRLPEAFAGYARQRTQFPVEYPTACSPQAWATGAPLLFIRTLLGLEPRGDRLTVDAALPPDMEWLEVRGLRGRWGVIDAVGRRSTVSPRHDEARAAPKS